MVVEAAAAAAAGRFQPHEHNAGDKGGQGRVRGKPREGEVSGERKREGASPGLGPGSATLPSHHLADCLDPEEN